METQYQASQSFRLMHPGARAAVGLVAAVAAVASAALVFGPLSDQRTLAMAGVSPRLAAGEAQGTPPLRLASSLPPAVRTK